MGGYGPAIVLGMCIVAAVAVTSIAVYGGPEGSLAEDWAGPAAGINCIASFGALSSLFCPHATGSFTSGAQGAIAVYSLMNPPPGLSLFLHPLHLLPRAAWAVFDCIPASQGVGSERHPAAR